MNIKDERIQQSQSEGGGGDNVESPAATSPTTPIPLNIMYSKEEAIIRQQLSQPAPNSTKKSRQDFDFIRTIGKGSYGKVKLVIEKETGKGYAAKILNKHLILKEKKAKYVNTEKTILDSLDHPNVVKLFYTFQDETNLYFILEYCPNGDLLEQLKKCSCFSLDVVRFYAAEILVTLEYLHSNGIAHRDLKPENILLSKSMHIKLSDFGTAKDMGCDPLVRSGSFCGTAEYVCPELLVDKKAGKTADLWSYGCLIYQIVSGKLPFKGFNDYQTFQLIIKRDFEFPPNFDPDAQDLVNRLLNLTPDKRPSFEEIRAHPFFEGVDFDSLGKIDPPVIVPIDPASPININSSSTSESSQTPRIRSQSEAISIPHDRLHELIATSRERSSSQTPPTTSSPASSVTNALGELSLDNQPRNPCKIYISPTDLLLGGKDAKKQLREEQKDNVWNKFLLPNNEIIMSMATLEKKTGLVSKKRVMIITDTPRIFYLDPHKMIVKGEIPVDSTLSAESKSMKHFVINTKGRHKHFFDLSNNCKRWVDLINDLKMLGSK